MKTFTRGLALGAVLVLGICALVLNASAVAADDKEEIKAAQKDILDIAKDLAAGKDVKDKAEAMKKKYEDLATIMHIYKPRDKGGLGFGMKGEGIEAKLNIIGGKKGISRADVTALEQELIRTSHVNAAVAEVTKLYLPKPKGGKGPKDWKEYADAMKAGSLDFAKAAKGGDPAKIKTAANNINNACNNCHTDFRD